MYSVIHLCIQGIYQTQKQTKQNNKNPLQFIRFHRKQKLNYTSSKSLHSVPLGVIVLFLVLCLLLSIIFFKVCNHTSSSNLPIPSLQSLPLTMTKLTPLQQAWPPHRGKGMVIHKVNKASKILFYRQVTCSSEIFTDFPKPIKMTS